MGACLRTKQAPVAVRTADALRNRGSARSATSPTAARSASSRCTHTPIPAESRPWRVRCNGSRSSSGQEGRDDVRNGIHQLLIPGPTNVPEPVRRAMNVPMQDHRAPDFPELTMPLFAGLKKIFATESGRVFVYPSSGTGAWEAAIPTPSTGRPGADVALRPALAPVGRDGAAARPRRHLRGRRVVGGGAPQLTEDK